MNDKQIYAEIEQKTSDIQRKIEQGIIPAHEVKIFKILVATSRLYLKKKKIKSKQEEI